MKYFCITFIVAITLLASGCFHGTHSGKCVVVAGQTVCFVREVWGFNGDRLLLTASANVCHQPYPETDYVSDKLGAGETVFYKIVDGKLYVYGVGKMIKPRKEFPVPVEFVWEFPGNSNPSEAVLNSDGYRRIMLEDMTWCLSDLR